MLLCFPPAARFWFFVSANAGHALKLRFAFSLLLSPLKYWTMGGGHATTKRRVRLGSAFNISLLDEVTKVLLVIRLLIDWLVG